MRITIVTQHYHPFIGGVETHARQVAHELSSAHDVSVVAGNFTANRLPPRLASLHHSTLAPAAASYDDGAVPVYAVTPTPAERLRLLPIAVRAVPVLPRYRYHELNRFGYRSYRAVFLPKLGDIVRGADIVHSLAGDYLGWAAEEAARRAGVPFVCTPFVHPQQWGEGPEDVAYYRRANAVIGLVDTDRDHLREIGVPNELLHVVGVSPDLPAAVWPAEFRARHGLGDAPVVLFVGRMVAAKGAPAILAATERVWERVPDARFVFIGPANRDSGRWFAQVDPRIRYLGPLSRQEKGDALAACDVFCMPSVSEILPTVYLEAWSYGKPVVGGEAPGLRDLVQGNGGGLSVPQSAADVAGALTRLLTAPVERREMGLRGRDLVERRYAVPTVAKQLLAVYAAATVRHSKAGARG
ncbi:glycosyl transferase family 1 [Gemmatimonadetes bacterium T265]|nr:glycosyl transferase family 1 [Gemmatimonadetes bacterium T265]